MPVGPVFRVFSGYFTIELITENTKKFMFGPEREALYPKFLSALDGVPWGLPRPSALQDITNKFIDIR
jgi:hypothetical protein